MKKFYTSSTLLWGLLAVFLGMFLWLSYPARSSSNQLTPAAYLPWIGKPGRLIYQSANLSGHSIFAECNPGGFTQCACSPEDAQIQSFLDNGMVSANPLERHAYVNAIGHKKFTENFPGGLPITLDAYIYSGKFKLTAIPAPNPAQKQNPEAVHLMIQFWDGRNALYSANKHTLEGTIFWTLNPWTADYGRIKIYTYPLNLVNTPITLTPDLEWHSFELAVDLVNKKYIHIAVDGLKVDLSGVDLAQVYQPGWGEDVSLNITTETENAYPQPTCEYIFRSDTLFRDLIFQYFR